jgi:hypothetical protein
VYNGVSTQGDAIMTDLNNSLKSGVVLVVFRKKDGTERRMECTTSLQLIPSTKHPTGAGAVRKQNDEVQKVFDLEKQEWRSFRKDSLISHCVI